MKLVFNLILVAIVGVLLYALYAGIKEPIEFKNVTEYREQKVIDKLQMIRRAQEAYRDVTGGDFAGTWDTLKQVLTEDDFKIVKIVADPNDPTNEELFRYDTLRRPAIDSIAALGIRLDSMEYVPFGDGAKFFIQADTTTFQKVLVNVVEVGANRKVYLGKYADKKYKKYDDTFNPNKTVKFGDMNKPTLAGNWE